ncbi:DUF1028 domain-containing protein [Halobacteriales archaeon QS_5_70_15]|nr:MAG: DUF1028 domain-containing protein [Halobacteriales archaeon QS_5_70_15]
MTFSICVREDGDGERNGGESGDGAAGSAGATFGVAVATDAPAVGALAPCVTGDGAISTQSFVNVRLGRRGVTLLPDLAVDDALPGLLEQDENASLRQVHGVDFRGNAYAFTGGDCDGWAGHRVEEDEGITAAGNMLVGRETVDAPVAAYRASEGAIGERLLAALAAGREAGGDERGHTSAAIAIKAPKTTAYHDLRVDEHETPIAELARVYEAAREASDGFSEDSKGRIFD